MPEEDGAPRAITTTILKRAGYNGGSGIVVFRYRYNKDTVPQGATVITETYQR
jgi:hypothetical protein